MRDNPNPVDEIIEAAIAATDEIFLTAWHALGREGEHVPSALRREYPHLSWMTIAEVIRCAAGETGREYDAYYLDVARVLEAMDDEGERK